MNFKIDSQLTNSSSGLVIDELTALRRAERKG